MEVDGEILKNLQSGPTFGFPRVQFHQALPALSKSCSKFPEMLLLFKKVANLNFNHAHIHCMLLDKF